MIVIGDEDRSDKAQEIHQRQLDRIEKRMENAIKAAIKTLQKNQKCWDLLSGGMASIDPVGLLKDSERLSFEIGDIFEESPGQVTSATTTVSLWSWVDIGNGAQQKQATAVDVTINELAGSFVSGGGDSQKMTILHEMGHAIYDLYGPSGSGLLSTDYAIQPDKKDLKKSEANTKKINEVCR